MRQKLLHQPSDRMDRREPHSERGAGPPALRTDRLHMDGSPDFRGSRVPEPGGGERRRRRRRSRWEADRWREDVEYAEEQRACIERQLAHAEDQLRTALEGPGFTQAITNGAPAGLVTGAGLTVLSGGSTRRMSREAWAGIALLAVASTYVSGSERHRREVERLQDRVFRLERELAQWRAPQRPYEAW